MSADIVALDYLINADVLLFKSIRVLLNVPTAEVIIRNMFGQRDFNVGDGDRGQVLQGLLMKTIIAMGTLGVISISIALAFSSWTSDCFLELENIDTLSASEFYNEQVEAQRCASVFENYVIPPELELVVQ